MPLCESAIAADYHIQWRNGRNSGRMGALNGEEEESQLVLCAKGH